MSLKYTSHTKHTVLTFSMHVRTIQHLNYGEQEYQNQFLVDYSDTPVTSKQGQGHQTWYELVDPKEGYNAQFRKSCLNSDRERANDKVFVKSGNNINYLP